MASFEHERSKLLKQLARLRRRVRRHPRLLSQAESISWRLRQLRKLVDASEGRSRPRVIVVDGHLDTCILLTRFLAARDCPTVAMGSGEEVLEFLDLCKPQLIFLDLSMPGMNGLDVLQAIKSRQHCGDVKVVIYSANDDSDITQRAFALGAEDFIVKSRFHLDRIRQLVESHVAA